MVDITSKSYDDEVAIIRVDGQPVLFAQYSPDWHTWRVDHGIFYVERQLPLSSDVYDGMSSQSWVSLTELELALGRLIEDE